MKAWVTGRRIKSGSEGAFLKEWAGDSAPEGMTDAFLLQSDDDPRETLSISLWDSAEALLKYRTSDDAHKRDDGIGSLTDGKNTWSRGYVAWTNDQLPGSNKKKKAAVFGAPVGLAVAAGLGLFLFLKKRKSSNLDDVEVERGERVIYRETLSPGSSPSAAGTPLTGSARPEVHSYTANTGAAAGTISTGSRFAAGAEAGAPQHAQSALEAHGQPKNDFQGGQAKAGAPPSRAKMLVREVMTEDPATVDHDATLAAASQKMRDLDVGVLPVMADGKLAGIVTDRDIALGLGDTSKASDGRDMRVRDVMSDTPVTVSPHVSVEEAAKLMEDHQVRRLPVVEGTRLVGIIALGDVAVDSSTQAAGEALERISEPSRPDR